MNAFYWRKRWTGPIRLVLTALVFISLTTPAFAVLKRVGPIDNINGFPQWYEDTSGLMLAPCFDPAYCGVQTPDSALDISFPDNFPSSFSYWSANATIPFNGVDPLGASTNAILNLKVTARFFKRTATPHFQEVSSKIHFSMNGLTPGAVYRVTYPYGIFTVVADTGGVASLNTSSRTGNVSSSLQ